MLLVSLELGLVCRVDFSHLIEIVSLTADDFLRLVDDGLDRHRSLAALLVSTVCDLGYKDLTFDRRAWFGLVGDAGERVVAENNAVRVLVLLILFDHDHGFFLLFENV